jgi:hypothetical protein
VPGVLNGIEVGGIGGPISSPNSIFLELFFDFDGSIDRGIVLHKYKIVVVVF